MSRNGTGFRPGSKYGQHFLFDERILSRVVDAAQVQPGDRVLEIGPGTGSLSACLLSRGAHVAAVEIDEALYRALAERFVAQDGITIVQADFMQVDLRDLWRRYLGAEPFRVVSNLPYYITSDVLLRLIWCGLPIVTITLMLQSETVDRLLGRKGRHTGALGVFLDYAGRAERAMDVPAEAFSPPPNVLSAVLHVRMGDTVIPRAMDEEHFAALVRAGFAARRKTLRNNIGAFAPDEQTLTACMDRCGIAPKARAEEMLTAQFVQLSDLLTDRMR